MGVGLKLGPGDRIGRYVVTARLGEGGMATVYRARGPDGRDAALKVLDAARRADSPGLVDRLRREAEVLAALRHVPAVVRLLEVFDDAERGAQVLALEFIDGTPLAARLGDPTLEPLVVLEWMGHVCHALNDVHAAGFVHRDLKPENLLLVDDPDQPIRLIDFNSAAGVGPTAGRLTRAQGAFPNTPAYLAPECFDGLPPDASADVYALGITFAELLLGRHPLLPPGAHDLDTAAAWQDAHERVPLPDLAAARPGVSPALQRVFERATAKRRADRLPDAVALWTELKRVWDASRSPQGDARAGSGVDRAVGVREPSGRGRFWIGLALGGSAVGLASVGAALLLVAVLLPDPEPPAPVTRIPVGTVVAPASTATDQPLRPLPRVVPTAPTPERSVYDELTFQPGRAAEELPPLGVLVPKPTTTRLDDLVGWGTLRITANRVVEIEVDGTKLDRHGGPIAVEHRARAGLRRVVATETLGSRRSRVAFVSVAANQIQPVVFEF